MTGVIVLNSLTVRLKQQYLCNIREISSMFEMALFRTDRYVRSGDPGVGVIWSVYDLIAALN